NSSTINEPEGYRLNKWFTSSEEAFDFVQHIKSDSKAWSFVSTGDGSFVEVSLFLGPMVTMLIDFGTVVHLGHLIAAAFKRTHPEIVPPLDVITGDEARQHDTHSRFCQTYQSDIWQGILATPPTPAALYTLNVLNQRRDIDVRLFVREFICGTSFVIHWYGWAVNHLGKYP
ncbi:hypothetical protein FOZ62_026995, partial [Perkinsus olseni]